jgi:hypothetical protein
VIEASRPRGFERGLGTQGKARQASKCACAIMYQSLQKSEIESACARARARHDQTLGLAWLLYLSSWF